MNKHQLKKQILQKELQIKKMHLHQENDVCNSIYNSLILEKAILNKQLEVLEENQFVKKLKNIFSRREKLICDYWK